MDFSKTIYIKEDRYMDGRSIVIFDCDTPFVLSKKNQSHITMHILKTIQNCIDLSIKNSNNAEFCVLVNLTNIKKCKLSVKFIIGISSLLKNAFPDKLYKCFLQNCSVVFRGIYTLVKTVIDKETRNKISIVQNGKHILYENTLKDDL
jgi:hypothetical protein